MSDKFLSKDEVDALLDGIGPDAAPAPVPGPEGVRPYDLAGQPRDARSRMPALERVHAAFARHFAEDLGGFLRRKPVITVAPSRLLRHSSLSAELPAPAGYSLVQIKPLRGNALLVCSPQLVHAVVDALFGGTGRSYAPSTPRELSATERRLVERVTELACGAWRRAWSGVHPLQPEPLRTEYLVELAAIASPADMLVGARFEIELGEASAGSLLLFVPLSALDPIRESLQAAPRGEAHPQDRRWMLRLSQQIESAEVELSAELGHASATVADLVSLRVGDFIEFNLAQTLVAAVDGVPVFECRYGISNGRYAIKVQSILTGNAHAPNGAPHGDR